MWTQDNFGEDLLINQRQGNIYYWDASSGVSNRAVVLSSLSGSNLAPTVAKQIMVSDRDRHVIAFGCDGETSIGTQDPLFVPRKHEKKYWFGLMFLYTQCGFLALRSRLALAKYLV